MIVAATVVKYLYYSGRQSIITYKHFEIFIVFFSVETCAIWKRKKAFQPTQLILTCSKSAMETLKKLCDMFKVNNNNTRNSHLFLLFLLLTLKK